MKHFLILLILVFFMTNVVVGQVDTITPSQLKHEIKYFKKLNRMIEKERFNLIQFKSKFGALEEHDLWKGYNKRGDLMYNYGSYVVTFFSKRANVVGLKIDWIEKDSTLVEKMKDADEEVKLYLEKHWKLTKRFGENEDYLVYKYEYKHPFYYEEFKQTIANELGEMTKIDLDSTVEMAYQFLIHPLETFNYGDVCFDPPRSLRGNEAVYLLKKEENVDLIRNLMKGYNPEGRAFGVEVMLNWYHLGKIELTEEDKMIITKIINSELWINSCLGCSGGKSNYQEAFEDYYVWEIYQKMIAED